MEPLTIKLALRYASILSKHLHGVNYDDMQMITLLRILLDNMKLNCPDDYIECVKLVSGLTDSELCSMNSDDVLGLFVEGMRVNRALLLVSFYRSLHG